MCQFKIRPLTAINTDFDYWNEQTSEKRLATLEEIRTEYNTWRYGARQEFQRVYCIIKLATGRLQDLADVEKLKGNDNMNDPSDEF